MSENQVCIFCYKHESRTDPYCPTNPGFGCTYGMHHDYGQGDAVKVKQQAQGKKPDKQLCTKCGLHAKNPAGATNGCEHTYPA